MPSSLRGPLVPNLSTLSATPSRKRSTPSHDDQPELLEAAVHGAENVKREGGSITIARLPEWAREQFFRFDEGDLTEIDLSFNHIVTPGRPADPDRHPLRLASH